TTSARTPRNSRSLVAEPSPSWRLDDEHVALAQLRRIGVAQPLDASIRALDAIGPRRTRAPTGHAERRMNAPVGEDRRRHRREEADAANRAVTAAPTAFAARSRADLE